MQEADVLLLILNRMLLVIARSICHTATPMYKQCYTALSAIARLPSIECSLQEANLSKGRMVVYPVVPELASSFNWCSSQNLVVSVALSSSYVQFVPTSPVTQCSIFYRRQVCSSVSLFEGVFDITSTCFHGENSVNQSGAGYIIPIPRSPWIYCGKPHLSLGLHPRDRVVFCDKSLVTVV